MRQQGTRLFVYSWEEVKRAVERNEDAQLERSLAEREVTEGRVMRGYYLVGRSRWFLELIGGILTGIYTAAMTLVFNYLLFVWILHVNFDP